MTEGRLIYLYPQCAEQISGVVQGCRSGTRKGNGAARKIDIVSVILSSTKWTTGNRHDILSKLAKKYDF